MWKRVTERRDRFVVRPRWWLLALTVAGCLGFTAMGLMMIASGEVYLILVGLLSVAFFGGGGMLLARFVARRGLWALTLTPAGIELSTGGLLPWEDIEAVGTLRFKIDKTSKIKLFGIRLSRYDRYLASVPTMQRVEMEWGLLRFLKPFALVFSGFENGSLLQSFATDVSSLETALRWNREQTGWDYAFSPVWLDRPTEQFVAFVERYRRLVAGS